jgi:hypothetical protein
MNKTFLLFAIISLISIFSKESYSQAPDWLWAKTAIGVFSKNEVAKSVASDDSNHIYVVGNFAGSTITFGTTTLNNVGTSEDDIFLTKYDSDGNVIWAKSAGGTGIDEAHSIALDTSGNIYVTGNFKSPTISFDTITLTNSDYQNYYDIFLVKYDANGNVQWAKSSKGTKPPSLYYVNAYPIAVNNDGSAIIAGNFASPTITFGTITLTNTNPNGIYDIFITKFDANGNVLWAKKAGGTSYDGVYSIVTDVSGNAYIAGYFLSPTITFGTTTLTNVSSTAFTNDLFIAKYDANGNALWAKKAGGPRDDEAKSVALDLSGNVYMAGIFKSPNITFGTITLTNVNSPVTYPSDVFLTKYDANGNVLWAKSAGGRDNDILSSVKVGPSGNIYVTGYFLSDTLILGSITLPIEQAGSANMLLAKYDSNGNTLWAKCTGEANGGISEESTVLDASENIYVAGGCNGYSVLFDSISLGNVGSGNMFLAKIGSSGTGIYESSNSLTILVFPNPTSNYITIQSPAKAEIEIFNIHGQILKKIDSKETYTTIEISDFATGLYIIKAKTVRGIAMKKFIVE